MRMVYECKCRDNCACVHMHSTIGVAKKINFLFFLDARFHNNRLEIGDCMHFRFPAVNILGAALPYIEPITYLCHTFAACGNV